MTTSIDPNHRLTVLLADGPNTGWAKTITDLLAPQGVQTVRANTGRDALRLIEGGNIHVAVLDQQMPQLGGLQVVKRMRELPGGSPPAILLADQPNHHLLHEALGMQVFSVLSKPVDFNLLLDSLARVMKRFYESRWPKE